MVTVQYNPFTPEAQANPYPLYRQLREQDPVHRSELMDGWVLTRYDDVVAVLKDARFSANRRKARNRFAQQAVAMEEQAGPLARANTMLSSDPPDHTRLRGLVGKAFTLRVVETMRSHIQEIVDDLLDAVQETGRMDIIQDLAYPLPVIVIAEMLGIPPEQRDTFKRWSDDLVATLGGPLVSPETLERGRGSAEEMGEYFHGVIEQRRREPKDDLLSGLIAAEERGEVLSEEELLATCMLLLAAGNETTTNLIGNGMLALFRNPDQFEKLRADPSLTESAIEEFLRYDGPVQGTGRVAKEEIEIGGQVIEEGQLAFCMLGAANRDPAQFSNPEDLDITRQDNRHIAFGFGIHFCLGAPLARMEAQIAFPTLLRRMPNLRLVDNDVEWGGSFILRGLKRLPAAF
ncbi:MAG: cytochrome P450 [Chloroflexi bacterium]|nr:cytochrome P450 [Chloroflexota bacterium]